MKRFVIICLVCAPLLTGSVAHGQAKYESEPINYSRAEPTDKVFTLSKALAEGTEVLEWDEEHGYLSSLLEKLNVPVESQALVFSKTSLQVSRITPSKPRAIYFNDEVYLGWVQDGTVIEISAADPEIGATFYSLSQEKREVPVIHRETSRCLQCHGSSHTRGRPGHIVRSVYPTDNGMPQYNLGTNLIDEQSEFEKRFGGWYVSGTHGDLRHRGNTWLPKTEKTGMKRFERDPSELDIEKGANVEKLDSIVDTSPYLFDHSDIVAQMVLQHQVHMHNVLTEAIYSGRQAAHDAKVMNKLFDREPDHESDSTRRRYDSSAERVVKALLFCDELELPCPIKGSSDFADNFEKQGPYDSSNRSLRQFDLKTRMFKFPCSFLIYSEAFKQLPVGVKIRVMKRLEEVFNGKDDSEEFEHLSPVDRRAIQEILAQTIDKS